MNISYFKKKAEARTQSELALRWTLPNFFTLGRFFLVVPLGWFLSHGWWARLFGGIVVYILSDLFDGHWARIRGEQSRMGRFLDSACDKVTGIGLLGVAVWQAFFPIWVIVPILFFACAQLGCALWAISQGRHRKGRLPVTYLFSLTAVALAIGFFAPSPLREYAYGLGVLASGNHFLYYVWLLVPPSRRRALRRALEQRFENLSLLRDRWRSRSRAPERGWVIGTSSNALTVLRAFFIFPAVFSAAQGSLAWLGWAAAFILLDIADGMIARKLHQTTETGKMLDIVIDKLFLIALGVTWWRLGKIDDGLAGLFVARVLVVAAAGSIAEKVFHIPRPLAIWSAPSNLALVLSVFFSPVIWEILAAGLALQLLLHYPYQLFLARTVWNQTQIPSDSSSASSSSGVF
jgi:phosphatidylglycerophosphate synthase